MNETIEQCSGCAWVDEEVWEKCTWDDVPRNVRYILEANAYVNIGTFNTGEFRKFRRTGVADPNRIWIPCAADAAKECGMDGGLWAVYANRNRDRSGLGVQVNCDGTTKSHAPKTSQQE